MDDLPIFSFLRHSGCGCFCSGDPNLNGVKSKEEDWKINNNNLRPARPNYRQESKLQESNAKVIQKMAVADSTISHISKFINKPARGLLYYSLVHSQLCCSTVWLICGNVGLGSTGTATPGSSYWLTHTHFPLTWIPKYGLPCHLSFLININLIVLIRLCIRDFLGNKIGLFS